ncbi:LacI family transcriptional regulator [bacterium]|nr:MAG: LacI family transcriptional regulator [bacterium]
MAYVGVSESAVFDPNDAAEDCLITYLSVMQETGRKPEFINSLPNLSRPQRIKVIREYFEAHGCPDAILCLHDEIAIITYHTLLDCGYRIPQDVTLAGCEGLFMMECFEPPLSTINQHLEEACELTWQFLQNRIVTPTLPLQQRTFEAKLMVRKSLQP